MHILRAIFVENDVEIIKQLRQFENENAALFSIVEIVPNFDLIIDLINTHKPDILIISGNEIVYDPKFLNDLSVRKPKLLFISNNLEDAYFAFKYNAIDFLQKPIDDNELIVSLYKCIKLLEMESVFHSYTLGNIKTINTLQQNFDYLAIASIDKIEFLKLNEIIFCKADGKYTEFYANNNIKMVSSRNLGEYQPSLDGNFFRIHHSYIVNIKYLVKIIKKDGLYCELSNGYLLPVAKRRQEEFIKYINL